MLYVCGGCIVVVWYLVCGVLLFFLLYCGLVVG